MISLRTFSRPSCTMEISTCLRHAALPFRDGCLCCCGGKALVDMLVVCIIRKRRNTKKSARNNYLVQHFAQSRKNHSRKRLVPGCQGPPSASAGRLLQTLLRASQVASHCQTSLSRNLLPYLSRVFLLLFDFVFDLLILLVDSFRPPVVAHYKPVSHPSWRRRI